MGAAGPPRDLKIGRQRVVGGECWSVPGAGKRDGLYAVRRGARCRIVQGAAARLKPSADCVRGAVVAAGHRKGRRPPRLGRIIVRPGGRCRPRVVRAGVLPQEPVRFGRRVDCQYRAVCAQAAAGARVCQDGHVGAPRCRINMQGRHRVGFRDARGKPSGVDVLQPDGRGPDCAVGADARERGRLRIIASGRRRQSDDDRVCSGRYRRRCRPSRRGSLQCKDCTAGAEARRGGRRLPGARIVHKDGCAAAAGAVPVPGAAVRGRGCNKDRRVLAKPRRCRCRCRRRCRRRHCDCRGIKPARVKGGHVRGIAPGRAAIFHGAANVDRTAAYGRL